MVHQAPVGWRPTVELEPSKHSLSVHQREGIDEKELKDIVWKLLHEKK